MSGEAIQPAAVRALRMPLQMGQAGWITVSVIVIGLFMCAISPAFRTYDNIFNDVRNFGFIAIMGMGQMLVIVTGGVDLSVGSVMGLVGIVTCLVLEAGYPLWLGVGAGIAVALRNLGSAVNVRYAFQDDRKSGPLLCNDLSRYDIGHRQKWRGFTAFAADRVQ